ncbi:D-alanyl-D-alanine carboxypeptidase family protein [Oryzifoliimicrobium ureilyticus]|uniref:D-alanyl-D-alanine carboxypeptidase family protein n=1 Tax=Oryzifoliimicrobium ureilyticus TaxID=3113724 RepID=UPI0030762FCF
MTVFSKALPRVCVMLGIFMAAVSSAFASEAHIVVNAATGEVLEASDADTLHYPASLTKMMTLYLAFSALKDGKLNWNDRLPISANADGKEPFKLGVGVGKEVTVREAVEGMVVLSANDAAAAIAEKLGGSEPAFGDLMTAQARRLGMTSTVFRNATGLPDPAQVTTARDMARLGIALARDFPTEFKMFSMRYITFRGMKLRGHNRLVRSYEGVDGIKTGYTKAAGYNLVTSVNRGGTRLVAAVLGGKSAQQRDDEMASLLTRFLPAANSGIATAAGAH